MVYHYLQHRNIHAKQNARQLTAMKQLEAILFSTFNQFHATGVFR